MCASRFLHIPENPRTLARFIGLQRAVGDTVVNTAVHMYVLYSCFSIRKHGQTTVGDNWLGNVYYERLRFAQLRCAAVTSELAANGQATERKRKREAYVNDVH